MRSRSFRFSPLAAIKLILIAAAAVGIGWLSVAVGAASVYRSRQPEVALRYAPFDARAQAAVAQKQAMELPRDRSRLGSVRDRAQAAIARDLTVVPAWRTLAVANEIRGDRERAKRLAHHAARLSRRDLPTQLWLIEERVAANDVPGALRHYDVALRVSEHAGTILFPVLAAAAGENSIIAPLRDLLAQRPPWRIQFLDYLSGNPPQHRNLLPVLGPLIASNSLAENERAALERLVQTLADREAPAAAFQLYSALKGGQRRPGVQNQDFSAPNLLPPFDWVLASAQGLRSEITTDAGRKPFLLVSAGSGSGGPVASQMMLLSPGRYRLSSAAAGGYENRVGNLQWTVTCAQGPAIELAEMRFTRRAPAIDFTVPAGCASQWLRLEVRSSSEPGTQEGGIDRVTISPAGRA